MNKLFRMAVVCCFAAPLGGCATWKMPKPPVGDVAPLRKERAAEAVRKFEVERDQAQYQAALGRWTEGDNVGCTDLLKKLLARSPKYREARLLLAQCYLVNQQLDPAKAELEQAIKDYPRDAELHHTLGMLLIEEGNRPAALAELKQAREIEPTNLLYSTSYESAEHDNTPAHASAAPKKPGAVDANPTPAPEVQQATALNFVTGGPATAQQAAPAAPMPADFDAQEAQPLPSPPAAPATPVSADAKIKADSLLDRGITELEAHEPVKAEPLLREAIKTSSDPVATCQRAASAALAHGESHLAVQLIEPILAAQPNQVVLTRMLGAAQYRAQNWEAARSALERSVRLDNRSAVSYFLLGCTLTKLGEDESGQRYLRMAARLDPRYGAQVSVVR